jgi:hypothetical protein
MTYDEFDETYKDCVEDFIHNLNKQLGTHLVYRDFDDYFYKMESIVVSEVNIEEDE